MRIGRRVFVGTGSIVLPGVTSGDNAIVGAGSVVRDDIPSGVLALGNPAASVCPIEQYLGRRREHVTHRPCWPLEGWIVAGGITEERKREMAEALADGHAYVR